MVSSGAMVMSKASTVAQYLRELDPDRRAEIRKVRALVKRHIPKGYVERMHGGMITWTIPLAAYPETYNGEPLCYAALAAQKSHNSLYLMGPYGDPSQVKHLREAFKSAGKRLDMGKSCLRFKQADDLALDAVAEVIAKTPPKTYIARYEAARKRR